MNGKRKTVNSEWKKVNGERMSPKYFSDTNIMTVREVAEKLELRVICGRQGLENEVSGGYASDLLSDVMGHADAGQVWITLQSHKNVMAIASLKDLAAVILISGNKPEQDTIAQSEEEAIPILATDLPCFEVAGKLYELLKQNA